MLIRSYEEEQTESFRSGFEKLCFKIKQKELDMDVSGLRHLNYIFHSKNSWYKYPKYYDP